MIHFPFLLAFASLTQQESQRKKSEYDTNIKKVIVFVLFINAVSIAACHNVVRSKSPW